MRRLALIIILAGVVMMALWLYYAKNDAKDKIAYRYAKVEKGSLVDSVSSTGTLNALMTVQVGSQVSGQIKELYADFNSEVREGEIIARLDPVNFEARVHQAEAELAVSKSNVAIQSASVERARAELNNARSAVVAAKAQRSKARVALNNAKRDLDRKMTLHQKSIIPRSQLDDAEALYEQALAQLDTFEAEVEAKTSLIKSREAALKMTLTQVAHAQAQVKQREASLSQSKVDLDHTVIRSPVNGTVIGRSVDMGQTVAASLQAPTLFTIAQDLQSMQVDTSVDEADIGRIQVGQRVSFTVDAFPGREFTGQVLQIRKEPKTVQNVVTYTVVVSAENPDLLLLPGMTANVQVVVGERAEALKVANGALRFNPIGEQSQKKPASGKKTPENEMESGAQGRAALFQRLAGFLKLTEEQKGRLREIFSRGREKLMALREGGATMDEIREEVKRMRQKNRQTIISILTPEQRRKFRQIQARRARNPIQPGRVWIIGPEGTPMAVEVMIGITDGNFSEIVRGDLEAGQEVITGISQSRSPSASGGRRGLRF